jgi:antitoxin (DNA-binding transcriptional repressor) of toxin-antitoxin stability system
MAAGAREVEDLLRRIAAAVPFVARGREVVITRHECPVACLVPADQPKPAGIFLPAFVLCIRASRSARASLPVISLTPVVGFDGQPHRRFS